MCFSGKSVWISTENDFILVAWNIIHWKSKLKFLIYKLLIEITYLYPHCSFGTNSSASNHILREDKNRSLTGHTLEKTPSAPRAKINHQGDTNLLLDVTCWGCNMLGGNMQADWGLDREGQGERDGQGDWDGRAAWIREKKIAFTMKNWCKSEKLVSPGSFVIQIIEEGCWF